MNEQVPQMYPGHVVILSSVDEGVRPHVVDMQERFAGVGILSHAEVTLPDATLDEMRRQSLTHTTALATQRASREGIIIRSEQIDLDARYDLDRRVSLHMGSLVERAAAVVVAHEGSQSSAGTVGRRRVETDRVAAGLIIAATEDVPVFHANLFGAGRATGVSSAHRILDLTSATALDELVSVVAAYKPRREVDEVDISRVRLAWRDLVTWLRPGRTKEPLAPGERSFFGKVRMAEFDNTGVTQSPRERRAAKQLNG